MFGFFRKSDDSKAKNSWTRKQLLINLAKELGDSAQVVNSSLLSFEGTNDVVELSFINNNYAQDGTVELNATITLVVEGKKIEWIDLFSLMKCFKPKNERPLAIRKNVEWKNSQFAVDAKEIIKPLLEILTTPEYRNVFLSSESIIITGRRFQLVAKGDNAWIAKSALQLKNDSKSLE